jgi:hypothetical protein
VDLDVTSDHPKAYTKPWSVKLAWRLEPVTDLIDSICEENNRDPADMIGKRYGARSAIFFTRVLCRSN